MNYAGNITWNAEHGTPTHASKTVIKQAQYLLNYLNSTSTQQVNMTEADIQNVCTVLSPLAILDHNQRGKNYNAQLLKLSES